jgi:hypothetical protein
MEAIREPWQLQFIAQLHRRNKETQKEIDRIESLGMRFGESLNGGPWSDITDREIGLLKHDIIGRNRTIARLEDELRDGHGTR